MAEICNKTVVDAHLNLARETALAAGRHLMDLFGNAEIRCKETSQNLVTQADIESEELITKAIQARFPQHRFLREEGESTGEAADDHLWIIDPLDATNNYAHDIPHFAVSIAYAEKGALQLGAIYDPVRRELFTAQRGQGAFLNDRPIRVSPRPSLNECIVATGFYYDRGELMQATLAAVGRLFTRNIRGMRRMGSAALDLCWLACSRFDGFFEYKLAPWDYAAGSLIVEEAGGRCADREGNPLRINSWNIVAANPQVFTGFLEAVRWPDSADRQSERPQRLP